MGLKHDLRLSRAPMGAFVAVGLVWAAFAAQVPVLKAGLVASDGDFGTALLLSSIGAIMAMWLAPIVGRALGRFDVMFGAVVMATAFLLPGITTNLVLFTIAMTLAAAGSGITDVLMNARVAQIEARENRALMNLNHAVFSFAYSACALMTGWAREAGYTPFQVFAVLAVIIFVLSTQMRGWGDHDTAAIDDTPRPVPHVLVWVGGLVVLMAFLTEAATEGWSALHLERTLQGGAAQGALGPAILGLTMGFGRLSGHLLSQARMRDTTLMMIACAVSSSGLAMVSAAPSLGLAYLGFGLVGLGISVVAPLALGLVGRSVPQEARLSAISKVSVMGYGAFFLGPPLMGYSSEWFGLRVSFGLIAGLLLVVAVGLIPWLARLARRAE